MGKLNTHWTDSTTSDFLYKIGADYIRQIEQKMESGVNQAQLASRLGVSKGRVSQVLKHPGNITLRNIIEYARSLGMKVSVIAYDDGDHENSNGPISPEIFTSCWEMSGRPRDFFDLRAIRAATAGNTESQPIPAEQFAETNILRSLTLDVERSAANEAKGAPIEILWQSRIG